MSLSITLRQLEIFVAVAEHASVTRAAERLHLTQSATSMAIAQLEKQLDLNLFERSGRRLALTERGRLLLAETPEILARVRTLPELLGGRGAVLRGELRIAASTTVGRYLIAPAMAAFAAANSAASVALTIANTETAAAAVVGHRADIAYVEGAVALSGLSAVPWRRDELVIVTSPGNWRQRTARIAKARLATLDWVMRERGSGTREVFESALKSAGLPPARPLMSLDDSAAIVQVLASGTGVACLSRLVVAESLRSKRLIALQAPYLSLSRELWRIGRKGSQSGPLQAAFDAFLDRR